jgi:hypothetical protein
MSASVCVEVGASTLGTSGRSSEQARRLEDTASQIKQHSFRRRVLRRVVFVARRSLIWALPAFPHDHQPFGRLQFDWSAADAIADWAT